MRLRPKAHRENLCVKTIVANVYPVAGAPVGVCRLLDEFDMPSRERHKYPVADYIWPGEWGLGVTRNPDRPWVEIWRNDFAKADQVPLMPG